jgi:hypothetical protein
MKNEGTMRNAWLCCGFVALLLAAPALAGPDISVGTYSLWGGTPGHTIQVWITGDGNLAGLNLFAQVGDGGPELTSYGLPAGTDGPSISAVNLQPVGGIFTGTGAQTNSPGIPQVVISTFDVAHGTVPANGLLAELTIDTTGLNMGSWTLVLKGVLPFSSLGGPYDTAGVAIGGQPVPISITNGSINLMGLSNWCVASGNWTGGSCWSAGEPNASMRANISNGGTVTVNQTGRLCSSLAVGSSPGQSGAVNMTGGSLTSGVAYVGYKGTGTFTESGGALYTADLAVGGDMTQKGGTGTFTISGGNTVVNGSLRIWNGSTMNLGLGTLVNSDANHPALDVFNDGTINVGDSNGDPIVYCLGAVTGDGSIVIGAGATLWVQSLEQDSVWINGGGTLVLAAEDPQLYAAIAMRNYQLAVPEPCSLVMLSLAGLVLAMHRKQRSQ